MVWGLCIKILTGVFVTGSFLYSLKKYFSGGVCKCQTRLDGLLIIITGSNSGIGQAAAIELALRGAHIILACRNVKAALNTSKYIIKKSGNPHIFTHHLDLTSCESIQKFSLEIHSKYDQLYGLVNNAGVFFHEQALTVDGYDITFQTNFLGHYYLTYLLLDLLKKSPHARIINVSSKAHFSSKLLDVKCMLKDPAAERCHFKAYGVSKLALVAFTNELARELADTNIHVHGVDPGNCETQIFRYFPSLNTPIFFTLQKPIRYIIIKTPEQGAQSVLHSLLYPRSEIPSGAYIVDCKISKSSSLANNSELISFLNSNFSKFKSLNRDTENDNGCK